MAGRDFGAELFGDSAPQVPAESGLDLADELFGSVQAGAAGKDLALDLFGEAKAPTPRAPSVPGPTPGLVGLINKQPAPRQEERQPGFMLRPEFVEEVRSSFADLPPEKRRAALELAAAGSGVRAQAAQRILADVRAEDERSRAVNVGREKLVDLVAKAKQKPVFGSGPAGRVQFPDVSPTFLEQMEQVPEKERIEKRLAREEAARVVTAAATSPEAIRDREERDRGFFDQVYRSFVDVGVPQAQAGGMAMNLVAQNAQMEKIANKISELEQQGRGDSEEAVGLRKTLDFYTQRQQTYMQDLAKKQQELSVAPTYRGVRQLSEAKTFKEGFDVFANDPSAIVVNLAAQSLPTMVPALVLGVINPALGTAAMGGSSLGVEFGGSLMEFAQEKGFDTRDPEQMAAFFADKKMLREGINKAGKRAGIVAAGDMFLSGLASKTMVPKRITGPVAKNVANMVTQMGAQAIGGGGFEAAAQLATEGAVTKPGEVLAELFGEFAGAPAEVYAQTRQAARDLDRQRATERLQEFRDRQPAPPSLSDEDRQTLVNYAQERLAELTRRAQGTEEQIVTTPDGKQVKVPATAAEFLSRDDKDELQFLLKHADNPDMLSQLYEITKPEPEPSIEELQTKLKELEKLSGIAAPEDKKTIQYEGQEYNNTPRIRSLIERAEEINSGLPPVPEGMTRLWRGNQPGQVGKARSFTNALVGIALPFQEAYRGPLTYVDVPTSELGSYESKGAVAEGSEFYVPEDLAASAKVVSQPKLRATEGEEFALGAEDLAAEMQGAPAPREPETEAEIEKLTRDQEEAAAAREKLSKRTAGTSLMKVLQGTLDDNELSELGGRARKVGKNPFLNLKAPKGKRGLPMEDMVDSGALDLFLPENMRPGSPDYVNSESAEYIREKLRNNEFYTYETQLAIDKVDNQIKEIERQIQDLLSIEDINKEIQYAVDEQRELDQAAAEPAAEEEVGAAEEVAGEEAQVGEVDTPAEEAAPIKDEKIRDKLKRVADNLGVQVFETVEDTGFVASPDGYVSIPVEDKMIEGVPADKIFAHELGHAIMQKRGMAYNRMSKEQVNKWIPGFASLEKISKEFRPGMWASKLPKQRRHARKNDEIIADALGAFLLGEATREQIKPLLDATGMTDFDLGLQKSNRRALEDELLKQYSEEEARKKQEREEQAAREEAEAKREEERKAAAPKAEEFVLTGSERAADQAAARGQMELAPAEEPVTKERPATMYKALPDSGFKRLAKDSERAYRDEGGKAYPTFEKGGARIAMSSNEVLYENENGDVEIGVGEPNETIVRALLVDPATRGQGVASKIMDEITELADEYGVTLYLEQTAISDKPVPTEKLKQFYKSKGFEFDLGNSKVMTRKPVMPERSTEEIKQEMIALRDEKTSLYSKVGKPPAIGTPKRARFDEVQDKLRELIAEYDKAEARERGQTFESIEAIKGAADEAETRGQQTFLSISPSVLRASEKRTPSITRRAKVLRRQFREGKISEAEYVMNLNSTIDAAERAEMEKELPKRVRGADYLRQRILEAKRNGVISEKAADLAEWFILKNPSLVDDLGISFKTPGDGEEGVAGRYLDMPRIILLMKDAAKDDTIVHEILHHLERMMPPDVRAAIRKEWNKQLANAKKNAKTENEKKFFELLFNFHYGDGTQKDFATAIGMIKNGLVSYDNYQYVNPSEFWAVNGSEIVTGRYDAIRGGKLQRLKNWLKELAQKLKSVFGLESSAPIIRALDSLAKADGKFVTNKMLAEEAPEFASIKGEQEEPQPSTKKGVEDTWLLGRDEMGNVGFGPGAKAYRTIADIANQVFDKAYLKPISPELGRAMRNMKAKVDLVQNKIAEVADEMSKMSPEEREMISDIIEGELKANIHPPQHVLNLAAAIQSMMMRQSQELVELGMLSKEAANRWENKYLPRFYERTLGNDVKAWAKAARELFMKQPTMRGIRGANLQARGIFYTIDPSELQDYIDLGWEQRDPDFNPKTSTETVVWRDYTRQEREDMGEIRDAMFRFVMGYNASQRDIALGRLYRDLAKNYASMVPAEGYVLVPKGNAPGTGAPRYGDLEGMYVPKEIMDHLSANDHAMASGVLKVYRAGLSKWKEGKTVLNPVSHANNVISNVTMAHFAGVSYWDAHKYAGAIKDLVKNDKMVKEAQEVGLFGGTFNQEEIMRSMPPQLKAMANMTESRLANFGERIWDLLAYTVEVSGKKYGARPVMQWAYENEDTFFRYFIYRDARNRGMDPEDARDYSQQFIFTYDDLPKGARVARDFAIPFFSYAYKVVPVLARTALVYPWRFAAPATVAYTANAAMYAMAASLGGDPDDWWGKVLYKYVTDEEFRNKAKAIEADERRHLPEWLKGHSGIMVTPKAIRMGIDDATGLPMFLDISRIFPGGDLLDANNNAGGVALFQPLMPTSPVINTLVAMLANKDMFLGKDVTVKTDTEAEKSQKRAAWLWKQMSPAISVGNYHFDRGMNTIAQMTGKPITIDAGPLGVASYTGIGKDGLPIQPKHAMLQTMGIKIRPYDLEISKGFEESAKRQLIREIDFAISRINRQEGKGVISAEAAKLERDKLLEKKQNVGKGLTLEGKEKK